MDAEQFPLQKTFFSRLAQSINDLYEYMISIRNEKIIFLKVVSYSITLMQHLQQLIRSMPEVKYLSSFATKRATEWQSPQRDSFRNQYRTPERRPLAKNYSPEKKEYPYIEETLTKFNVCSRSLFQ